jgi:hypothetical protein
VCCTAAHTVQGVVAGQHPASLHIQRLTPFLSAFFFNHTAYQYKYVFSERSLTPHTPTTHTHTHTHTLPKHTMYGPTKFVALFGLIVAAAVPLDALAASVPLDAVAADCSFDITTKSTEVKMSSLFCGVHYEVYSGYECSGRSNGMCAGFDCTNLRGIGSQSIILENNIDRPIWVTAYSDFDCSGEVQKIWLVAGTSACLRYHSEFNSMKAEY